MNYSDISNRFTDKGSNDSGSNDTGSNDKGSNDKGSNDTGSNDKGSKARQRVKRHRVKKCDKGANFFEILTSVTVSIYLLLFRVRLRHFLGRALRLGQARGPSAAATWSIISMSNI